MHAIQCTIRAGSRQQITIEIVLWYLKRPLHRHTHTHTRPLVCRLIALRVHNRYRRLMCAVYRTAFNAIGWIMIYTHDTLTVKCTHKHILTHSMHTHTYSPWRDNDEPHASAQTTALSTQFAITGYGVSSPLCWECCAIQKRWDDLGLWFDCAATVLVVEWVSYTLNTHTH